MQYQIKKDNNISFFLIQGDVDRGKDCQELSKVTGEILNSPKVHLVFDLSSTNFVSSAFCGFISSMAKKARQNKSRLSIILNTSSLTYEIFNIAGVNQIVDLYPSMDSLMRVLANQKP